MSSFADTIAAAGRFSRGYAELMLKGVTADQFARKPRFETSAGVKVIDTNHPAFVFGHLALYPTRLVTTGGGDAQAIKAAEAPALFVDLFKAGAECRDDQEGTLYPPMDVIVKEFFRTHDLAVAFIQTLPDELLSRPNPNEKARDRFPTIGVIMNFYLNGHIMVHLGQISAWRRCLGLPSAM